MARKKTNFTVSGVFFNEPQLVNQVKRNKVKALRKMGFDIRKIAKSSMKRSKVPGQVSPPGKPPLAKTGLLQRHIYYTYDRGSESVVVGPAAFKYKKKTTMNPTVPELLEFGGRPQGKNTFYIPRPYMRPARDQILPRSAEYFKNILFRQK
jgi:hypothetical protein